MASGIAAPANMKKKASASRGADGRRKSSLAQTNEMRYEEAWFNFHRYDKDGNGTIDASELAGLLADLRMHVGRTRRTEEQMQEWVKRELRKSDANGDGVLSFEEFLSYYNSFVARHRSQCD